MVAVERSGNECLLVAGRALVVQLRPRSQTWVELDQKVRPQRSATQDHDLTSPVLVVTWEA